MIKTIRVHPPTQSERFIFISGNLRFAIKAALTNYLRSFLFFFVKPIDNL